MKRTILFFAVPFFAACSGGDLDPGYTSCGGETCQPGQYCFDQLTGFCANGCTSNANCQDGHACQDISDVTGTGTCTESATPPPPPPPPGNALAACQAACDGFQDCGLAAGEVAECRHDCTGLTENQQTVVGNCAGRTCGDQLLCLGVDCFSDRDCGGGQSCVGMTCL